MHQRFLDWFWPVYFAWSNRPALAFLNLVVGLLLASYPALNVLLIGYLGAQLHAGASVVLPLTLIVVLFGLHKLIDHFYTFIGRLLVGALIVGSSVAVNNKLTTLPPKVYNDQQFLEQLRQARAPYYYYHASVHYQAISGICEGVFAALALAWSLWSYSRAAAVISILLPIPLIYNLSIYGKIFGKFWPQMNDKEQRTQYLYNQLDRDRTGFDLVSLGAGAQVAEIAAAVQQQWYSLGSRMARTALRFASVGGVVAVTVYALCLWFLAHDGSVVSLLAGIFGLLGIMSVVESMAFQVGMLAGAIPSNRSLRKFLALSVPPTAPLDLSRAAHINFHDVQVRYGDKQVVHGVSLELRRNRLTALVGANGSGKTTLIKALMGAQLQATGKVEFAGSSLELGDATTQLGYATVNQEFQKFDLTIREFLTLGITTHIAEAELWEALTKVEFADYVRNLAQGLDTPTGVQWGGVDFSGGQWQRLCVARGLLSRAGLLFLDEPTSAIDARTEERIFAHLAQASSERLILLTTHRVSTLKDADLIYVMEAGKIVESGSFTQLNQPGTKFRALFEAQFIAEQQAANDSADATSEAE